MLPSLLFAQSKIRINILSHPAVSPTDAIYIAGNFNNWNPGHPDFKFKKANGTYYLETGKIPPGPLEFKFTRGTWETVEVDSEGSDIINRRVQITSDSILNLHIEGWKNDFPEKKKRHTASANVKVLDSAFFMPQLNRKRRIWIYLPSDYAASKKRYPVLYMHDGQNLFDEFTAYSGEWGIDKTLDSIASACIVVGIDNGGTKRINEYTTHDNALHGKGEGQQYLEFIVKTLKPYIDKNFRTFRQSRHTLVAGSSMGGLITFYAAMYYPRVFGRVGIFSPSFWMAPQLPGEIRQLVKSNTHGPQRYFFYAGTAEGARVVSEMVNVSELMRKHANPQMHTVIKPGGQHNELTWGSEFPAFYKWIMDEENTGIKKR